MAFLKAVSEVKNMFGVWLKFAVFLSQVSNLQKVNNIGLGNSLVLNKRQAITWTNVDQYIYIYIWHHYDTLLGRNELNMVCMHLFQF